MADDQSLRILIVDDERILHQTLSRYLHDLGHLVDSTFEGTTALEMITSREYHLVLLDILMPGMDGMSLLPKIAQMRPDLPIVMITGHGNMDMAIQALRSGAADFLRKPIKLLELDAVLEKTSHIRHLREGQQHLRNTIRGIQTAEDIRLRNRSLIGRSKQTAAVRRQIRLAVEGGCDTILITGETGAGKEIVAREIHFSCGDDRRPFIAVSCPAIPDTLVESELFGHVKGAFTGATQDKAGDFELADGGTLFLDEIADLSLPAQAKILRVLETRKFRRVGGSREIHTSVRVIAATNATLEELAESSGFRKDLFYRLNVFTIHLAPLRERRPDILPLAEHFLAMYTVGRGLCISGFSEKTREALLNYDFPGNARELRNIIERAAILCRSGEIRPEHLNLPSRNGKPAMFFDQCNGQDERARIISALERVKWNRRKAAETLGIPYSTLNYKIRKFGI
ncbi:MAG: sigma-54-dependent transcriptional regulator [bacterium]